LPWPRVGRSLQRAILDFAQEREHGVSIFLFVATGDVAEDFLHDVELLGIVVDHEIGFVAELLNVPAQDAYAQRMKRADGGFAGLFQLFRHELPHALFHLARRLVRERHRQDIRWGDAALDHMGDPMRDHARLARPGPRENQHRPFQSLRRQPLLRVQRTQIHHRAREFKNVRGSRQANVEKFVTADPAPTSAFNAIPRIASDRPGVPDGASATMDRMRPSVSPGDARGQGLDNPSHHAVRYAPPASRQIIRCQLF
jgi:hypothetical protein